MTIHRFYLIREIARGRSTITLCNILSPLREGLKSSNHVEENHIVKARKKNNNIDQEKQ